ncbi:MAG: JAB domain-containing protein, partial [Enterococcus sp.]
CEAGEKLAITSKVYLSLSSGSPIPSKNDDDFTLRMKEVCSLIGIDLLDHIVVTDSNSYYSYREEKRVLQ